MLHKKAYHVSINCFKLPSRSIKKILNAKFFLFFVYQAIKSKKLDTSQLKFSQDPGRVIYLLKEVDTRLQIQSIINKVPVDVLGLIFCLFFYEHGVIEQLLQLLIRVVDAQLLIWIVLQTRIYPCSIIRHTQIYQNTLRSIFFSNASIRFKHNYVRVALVN